MANKRDTWVYELRKGRKIVYYGITNNPQAREEEHKASGKTFTHMNLKSRAMCRENAEKRETDEIQRYQKQHGGKAPKYNTNKPY